MTFGLALLAPAVEFNFDSRLPTHQLLNQASIDT